MVETRTDPARGTPDGIDDLAWDSDWNSTGHGCWGPSWTRWVVYDNETAS